MFLLIDKPKGITSHDVVHRLRKILNEKRIGHGGTLDPNATGLLIVGIGRDSTKKLDSISKNKDKTYEAQVVLGETRTTDDIEGEIKKKVSADMVKQISKQEIAKVLSLFKGKQKQTPPAFSAIKIKGKKAYELARKGINLKLKPRNVVVYSIKLKEYKNPLLIIETKVSSGTYIRALARDIGEKLGCGAYLKELRRTRIGEYDVKDSVKLGKLNKDNWKQYGFN